MYRDHHWSMKTLPMNNPMIIVWFPYIYAIMLSSCFCGWKKSTQRHSLFIEKSYRALTNAVLSSFLVVDIKIVCGEPADKWYVDNVDNVDSDSDLSLVMHQLVASSTLHTLHLPGDRGPLARRWHLYYLFKYEYNDSLPRTKHSF